MSIRGIDAQMMITRSAELAKDSSALLKKNELTQDYLAVQSRLAAAHEKQTVAKPVEVEKSAIQLDKEPEQRQGEGEGPKKKGEDSREYEDPNKELLAQLDDPEPRTIDITI